MTVIPSWEKPKPVVGRPPRQSALRIYERLILRNARAMARRGDKAKRAKRPLKAIGEVRANVGRLRALLGETK